MMGFFIFLPFMAAIIGIVIGFLCFIGFGLLVIGCTGIMMNRMYSKLAITQNSSSNHFFHNGSIVLGLMFILFPLGYVLYGIISALIK